VHGVTLWTAVRQYQSLVLHCSNIELLVFTLGLMKNKSPIFERATDTVTDLVA